MLANRAEVFSRVIEAGQSQNAQRPFFHLLGLCGGFVEARLEVRPSMFPRRFDG
jgi:hypothetical protein